MDGETESVGYAERARDVLGFSRWWQVAAAAVMMGAVSPYQYVWSSIQAPLASDLNVSLAALGVAFSLYVLFQSVSQFPAGWWRDRHGPRRLIFLAAVLAGGGYVGLAYARSLWQLYLLYSLGAVGVGIVYTVAVNTALKWFPDRSGITTGIGTMAFAAGSTALIPYVRANATVAEYPSVLRNIGLLIFVALVLGAALLRDPPDSWESSVDDTADESDAESNAESDAESNAGNSYTWREVVRTWQFWLLYAMFVAISGADLLVIAQIIGFADRFGFSTGIATIAATVLPLASGGSRIVVGDLSDRFSRTRVMAAAFVLAGVLRGVLILAGFEGVELVFVVAVVLSMFFSSPLYVLFPSLLGDYFGTEHSSSNYALLYTAKIGGGVIGGTAAGYLISVTGWATTFALGGVLAVAAGLGALALRSPK